MAKSVNIIFKNPPSSHQMWFFAEELSLVIERGNWGIYPMSDADAVTDRILVSNIRARQLRRVLGLINELLGKHCLKDCARAMPVE